MKRGAYVGFIALFLCIGAQAEEEILMAEEPIKLTRESDKKNQASEIILKTLHRKHPELKKQLKIGANEEEQGFTVVLIPVRK